jgi:hypothetical protein
MMLADLTKADVEVHNRKITLVGYSQSQVSDRLQTIHALIERADRPNFGISCCVGSGSRGTFLSESQLVKYDCLPFRNRSGSTANARCKNRRSPGFAKRW